ncbi:hypothetical protein A4X13_0g2152 [Tilletia indica]|uniref:Uncharacterized protein n=1 Tax=Tilletia indica TaxID=43049 RepID=A0A177TNF0_9BASI|nr:hypothetical protein A4X13_0g2152 [Tilletia indica]
MAACMHSPSPTSLHAPWSTAGSHQPAKRSRSGASISTLSCSQEDAPPKSRSGSAEIIPYAQSQTQDAESITTTTKRSPLGTILPGNMASIELDGAQVEELETHVPFPRRTGSPSLQPPTRSASSSIPTSPCPSHASTSSSDLLKTNPTFFRSSTQLHSRSPFGLESNLGQHRYERSSSSAASVSSTYSSAYSHVSEETPVCDPPTLELSLGTLLSTPHGDTQLEPGVTPAFLVISVINHILFSRGALDIPLRLEPLLSPSAVLGKLGAPRSRTQSLGSVHSGGGSKGRGKQNKLVVSLHKLHADLLSAFKAIYANGSAASSSSEKTCDAHVSVLISFGASPLLPKEHLHIALTLPGVPSSSTSRSPTLHAETASSSPSATTSRSGTVLMERAVPSDTRQISKSLTTLQRKVLRFIVSQDSLQPEAFSNKLPNRMHVLMNVQRRSETLSSAPDALATMTCAGEETVERQGTFFPATEYGATVEGSADVETDTVDMEVPKGWSFRRNARIPPEVIRLQTHLLHPQLSEIEAVESVSIEETGTNSGTTSGEIDLHWTSSPVRRSRSGSPCSTATVDEYRSCNSSAECSRLGSVSPSLPLVDDDDEELLPRIPSDADVDNDAAADITVPPLSQPHSQMFNISAGSSTPTALPFAPSPLRRNANSDLVEENVVRPPLPRRVESKSRLRGGFVLLRKTTSSTFPPPSSSSSSSTGMARPRRLGPRSSTASSLSLSFSGASVGEEDEGGVEGEEVDNRRMRTRSHLGLGVGGGRTMSGLKAGRKSVPVHSLVLDLRSNRSGSGSNGEENLGESDRHQSPVGREGADGRNEEEEPQWWICDTVVPLR